MKAKHNRHFIKRRSVALISAAIFCASAAHAELEVGRLPSTSVTGGQLIGVKPNVFLVISNGAFTALSTDGNFLQQTSAALITTLPQLEGKIRLGYTKALPDGADCTNTKLNGNINRLTFNGIEEVKKNKNYVTGENDFVFGKTGSGLGEIVPRDFEGNFARYIYSWIGGTCKGGTSDKYLIPYKYVAQSRKQPPYDNLSKDPSAIRQYKASASAANNPNSYPLKNFTNLNKKSFSPMGDRVVEILGIISDRKFLSSISAPNQCDSPNKCAGVSTKKEMEGEEKVTLRTHPYFDYFDYDAYAKSVYNDINRDEGFPDKTDPLSCRKNYILLINDGPIAHPAAVGTNMWYGVHYVNNLNNWKLPSSHIDSSSNSYGITGTYPHKSDETLPYQFLPNYDNNNKKVIDIPSSGIQGSAGRFNFAKLALTSYYSDLRSNLKNDVPAFYAQREKKQAGSITINKEWNRENDPANWQHAVFFVLGHTPSFPSWIKASIYNDNYPDLNPIYPHSRSENIRAKDLTLEGYFRAVEDGSIRESNAPLFDWSRGGFALTKYNKNADSSKNIYIYKDPSGRDIEYAIIPPQYPGVLDSFGSLQQMDIAKAGIISRGGAYPVNDYESVKKAIGSIADRIEKAMAQEVSGAGAVSGGGRVTAVQQMGGNSSALFTSYIDEETVSGNLFAYRNCPLIKEKIKNGAGNWVTNPEWIKGQCGQRLWNAATVLEKGKNEIEDKTIFPKKKDGKLVGEKFSWSNIKEDSEAKSTLQGGESEELAKARVEWINGKEDFSDANIAKKLRKRPNILIPKEGQRYKIGSDGKPVQDDEGNYVLMDEPGTKIPNRVGEIVYATAQAVDPVGTLGAAHKLNNGDYDTFKNKIKKRPPLVLAGANDGRLYGFTNPKDHYAKLAFSYIPRKVIVDGRLTATTKTSYSTVTAKSLVNGPFRVSDAQVDGKWGTYVVGTLGAGGSTAYALEITSKGEAEFKWEIDIDEGRAKIMAPPRIVWLKKDKSDKKGQWVVLLPSGYNADNVSLIVLDLKDGKELARIDTGAKYNAECKLQNSGSNPYKLEESIKLPEGGMALCVDNGLGDLTVTDANGDDAADYVYAGDLLGHVWKFDLTDLNLGGNNDKIKVAYESPLFVAKDKQGVRQSITTMIEIDDGAYGEGSMLYFGTGRLFNQQERNMKQRQSFYAVWENPRYFENLYVQLPLKRDESSPYAFMQYEPVTITDIASKLSDPESSLKEYKEIRVIKRVDSLETDKYLSYDRNGTNINSEAKAMGWVMDFPQESARERVIDRARTFEEAIFFSSFEPKESEAQESCEPPKGSVGGNGRFYMLDRLTGNTLETAAFDYNHDNKRDDQDKIKVDSSLLGGTLGGTGGGETSKLVSPASLMTPGSANFVQLEGVQERGAECDYTRQVIFPGTVDPETGNPMTLLGCYQNRYRIWKQPVSGN